MTFWLIIVFICEFFSLQKHILVATNGNCWSCKQGIHGYFTCGFTSSFFAFSLVIFWIRLKWIFFMILLHSFWIWRFEHWKCFSWIGQCWYHVQQDFFFCKTNISFKLCFITFSCAVLVSFVNAVYILTYFFNHSL